jgi:hypothetical protein
MFWARTLKMDAKLESAVEVVEAEIEDENDIDVGRGVNTVDTLGSKVSEFGSIVYVVMICGGRGCRGGRGGIGKLRTGPNVTCRKIVVK